MSIKHYIYRILYYLTLNPIIRKTQWYKNKFVDYNHEIYPDNTWYRSHDQRNYQLVALGSSSAKCAYDFENVDIKAMNWANRPQTLLEDYNLLRCYHSILANEGIVIITIMPFTSLNKETGVMDAFKYLQLNTQGEPIQPHYVKEAMRLKATPALFGKPAIKAAIKYILGREGNLSNNNYLTELSENPMNDNDLNLDASRWVDGWKKQFNIDDFNAPLTYENIKGQEYRIELMRTLVDFCIERGYKPVYVILPVTKHLSKYFTPTFEERYIYGFLREVNREVKLLDYSKCDILQDVNLYYNSFFLNKRGRKIFTEQLLKDVGVECDH